MEARLYRPADKGAQSGRRPKLWVLEIGRPHLYKEPLRGWTGEIKKAPIFRLEFSSKERALTYVKEKGLTCKLIKQKKTSFFAKSYADNFRVS